jgi:hypothetical protein
MLLINFKNKKHIVFMINTIIKDSTGKTQKKEDNGVLLRTEKYKDK